MRCVLIDEAVDTIRVETWEGILIDILNKSAMEIIECFDFNSYFTRTQFNAMDKDAIQYYLGAWKFSSDEAEQKLSSALRTAFMYTIVGYYCGDRKDQYSCFIDYFEEEFYKRVSLLFGIWTSISVKSDIQYVPLYDSFYNLSNMTKSELIDILKAVLDNDTIAIDEKQTLKEQLIESAGYFHSNITTANVTLEQDLIKPAINYIMLREKAKETIESAVLLCDEGKYIDCANRCYYAMMFSLKALLGGILIQATQ